MPTEWELVTEQSQVCQDLLDDLQELAVATQELGLSFEHVSDETLALGFAVQRRATDLHQLVREWRVRLSE